MDTIESLRVFSGRLGGIFFRMSMLLLTLAVLCIAASFLAVAVQLLMLLLAVCVTLVTFGLILFLVPNLWAFASGETMVAFVTGAVAAAPFFAAGAAAASLLSLALMIPDLPESRAKNRGRMIGAAVVAALGVVAAIVAVVVRARGAA